MADVIPTIAIIVLLVLLAMTIAGLLNVLKGGVRQTDEYLRGGVGLRSLMLGEVPEQDSGSLVTVREGLKACVNENGELEIRGTRTIARDSL